MLNDYLADLLGDWVLGLNVWSCLLRIGISVLLAAILGWERSSKRHAAGLRTFILVSLASTLTILLDQFLAVKNPDHLFLLSAASVLGIATICVNSILFNSRNQIKGLTTSVGLWACGIVGLLIGAGCYTVTLAAFLALLASLSLFPTFERYLKNRSNHFEIHIELKSPGFLQEFVATIRKLELSIDDIEANPAYAGSGLSVYTVLISIRSPELKKYKTHKDIIEALASLDYINYIEEIG